MLESVYEVSRQKILDSIDELLLMPLLEFEVQSVIRNFVSSVRETKMDLSDLLIAIPKRNCLTHLVKQSACKELISILLQRF